MKYDEERYSLISKNESIEFWKLYRAFDLSQKGDWSLNCDRKPKPSSLSFPRVFKDSLMLARMEFITDLLLRQQDLCLLFTFWNTKLFSATCPEFWTLTSLQRSIQSHWTSWKLAAGELCEVTLYDHKGTPLANWNISTNSLLPIIVQVTFQESWALTMDRRSSSPL